MLALCLVGSVACGRSAGAPSGVGGAGDGGAGAGGEASNDGPGVDAEGLPPFPPARVSGSRLRARNWVTDGGAQLPDSTGIDGEGSQVWFDTELETPCAFQKIGEAFVCLPLTRFEVLRVRSVAGCEALLDAIAVESEPHSPTNLASLTVGERDARCGKRRYALDFGASRLAPRIVEGVYEIADAVDVASWPAGSGDCFERPADGSVVYAVGRRLELNELVTAEAHVLDTIRRLNVTELVANDGSRETTSLYDTQLQTECSPGLATDGKTRCIPSLVGQIYTGYTEAHPASYLFADPACRIPLGYWLDTTEEPPTSGFVTEVRPPNSAWPFPVFRVLGLADAEYSPGVDGECHPVEQIFGEPGLALEVVEPQSLTALYEVTTEFGPLSLRTLTDRQGATAVHAQAWDNATQQACSFRPAVDGGGRCFPSAVPAAYASDDCTSVIAEIDGRVYPEPYADYVREWQGEMCSGGLVMRSRGDVIVTPKTTSTHTPAHGCYSMPHNLACSPGYTYCNAGDVLDLDAFVPGSLE